MLRILLSAKLVKILSPIQAPLVATLQIGADIEIALTPTSDRERAAEDMQEKLKVLVEDVEGAEKIRISLLRPGPPQGADIEVTLVSENDAQRALAADRLEEILKNN